MNLPIRLDKRYHLTQEAVDEMRQLRKKHWTYQEIADKFEISISTAYYWNNHVFRIQLINKNTRLFKKQYRDKKLHAERDKERKQFMKENYPEKYTLENDYRSAMYETRCKRITSKGRTLDELKEEYERQKSNTSQKIF